MDGNRHYRRMREHEWVHARPARLPSAGRLFFVVLALLALGIQVLVPLHSDYDSLIGTG